AAGGWPSPVTLPGGRGAGSVQVGTTALKVLPLVAIAGLGAYLFVTRDPQLTMASAPTTYSLDGITAAAALTLWALLGLESATIPGGKVQAPHRTIPPATL